LMHGYEGSVAEGVIPDMMVRGMKHQNADDFNRERKIYGKSKFRQCKGCKFDSFCEGPWREYVEKRGDKEFKPIN